MNLLAANRNVCCNRLTTSCGPDTTVEISSPEKRDFRKLTHYGLFCVVVG
jgi:hypothetical protein